jgi:replication factor C large subunit
MQSLAEKYRAKVYKDIIGQPQAVQSIKTFLQEFPLKKALLLHGPAGTGKTSLVLAAAKENNLEIYELNASDLRNKAKLQETLKHSANQVSLFKTGKILLVDEVDGVTGTDRGGIPELARIIQDSKYPIIMTCNDAWQSKLSPIRSKSKLLELKPLQSEIISSYLKQIAQKENIQENPHFLNQIALKSQGDMRAALNDLQTYSKDQESAVPEDKRHQNESIFNILKRVFKERQNFLDLYDNTSLSLDEVLLWLEENIPKEYQNQALANAYHALGKADSFRGRIYKNQTWRFLIYQNIFQSAGISYAKTRPSSGFTKYERPKRILKIWLNNQKIAKKKTIASKLAKYTHCSSKQAMRDFKLLQPILQNPNVQSQLRLSEEEIDFLKK